MPQNVGFSTAAPKKQSYTGPSSGSRRPTATAWRSAAKTGASLAVVAQALGGPKTSTKSSAKRPASSSLRTGAAGAGTAAAAASVQVVARIRPRLTDEREEQQSLDVSPDEKCVTVTTANGKKEFVLDQVFDSRKGKVQQDGIFRDLGTDMIEHSMKGFNVCTFAYGHTGSGKTYTMLGATACHDVSAIHEGSGFIPRFLHRFWNADAQDGEPNDRRVVCSFYELHNDKIRDLLSATKSQAGQVHTHPEFGVWVENLTMSVITSAAEAFELLNFGSHLRTVASTTLNARSSRSHCFFVLRNEASSTRPSTPRRSINQHTSTVTFVDLAGREERAAVADVHSAQFREMNMINTSLFFLAHLVSKLTENRTKVSPAEFRNSKLTLLLSQALTGSCRTTAIVTLSPFARFAGDSLSTLNFAASMKRVKTRPAVNAKSDKQVISELETEVKRLQAQLAQQGNQSDTSQDLASARAFMKSMKQSWDDVLAWSEKGKLERELFRTRHGIRNAMGETGDQTFDGKVPPFLTKLADEPSLQGCCNYLLNKKQIIIGNDADACDVILEGLGITSQLCKVCCDKEGLVLVELLDFDAASGLDGTRVVVKGNLLSHSSPSCQMEHGDALILGYAHAFRLVIPNPQAVDKHQSADLVRLARRMLDSLDVASAVQLVHTDEQNFLTNNKDLQMYMNHLSLRSSPVVVQSAMRSINKMIPLIAEANFITKEVLGNDHSFELHCLTDMLEFSADVPQLVVCIVERPCPITKFRQSVETIKQNVLSCNGQSGASNPIPRLFPPRRGTVDLLGKAKCPMAHSLGLGDNMMLGEEVHLLSVLTIEDFIRRLEEVRDIYSDAADDEQGIRAARERILAHPFQNPWRQAPFADVKWLSEVTEQFFKSPLLNWMMKSTPEQQSKGSATSDNTTSPSPVPAGQQQVVISRCPSSSSSFSRAAEDSSILSRASSEAGLRNSVPNAMQLQITLDSEDSSEVSQQSTIRIPPLGSSKATTQHGAESRELIGYLGSMASNTMFADVDLVATSSSNGVAMERVPAHRLVLARFSYFEDMLGDVMETSNDRPELLLHGVSPAALRRLLIYIYTDSVDKAIADLLPEELNELLMAADVCELPDLRCACCDLLLGPPRKAPVAEVVMQPSTSTNNNFDSHQIWSSQQHVPTAEAPIQDLQQCRELIKMEGSKILSNVSNANQDLRLCEEAVEDLKDMVKALNLQINDLQEREVYNSSACIPEGAVVWRPRNAQADVQSYQDRVVNDEIPAGSSAEDILKTLRAELVHTVRETITSELCQGKLRGADTNNRIEGVDAFPNTLSQEGKTDVSPAVLSSVAAEVSQLVQKLRTDLRHFMQDEIHDQLQCLDLSERGTVSPTCRRHSQSDESQSDELPLDDEEGDREEHDWPPKNEVSRTLVCSTDGDAAPDSETHTGIVAENSAGGLRTGHSELMEDSTSSVPLGVVGSRASVPTSGMRSPTGLRSPVSTSIRGGSLDAPSTRDGMSSLLTPGSASPAQTYSGASVPRSPRSNVLHGCPPSGSIQIPVSTSIRGGNLDASSTRDGMSSLITPGSASPAQTYSGASAFRSPSSNVPHGCTVSGSMQIPVATSAGQLLRSPRSQTPVPGQLGLGRAVSPPQVQSPMTISREGTPTRRDFPMITGSPCQRVATSHGPQFQPPPCPCAHHHTQAMRASLAGKAASSPNVRAHPAQLHASSGPILGVQATGIAAVNQGVAASVSSAAATPSSQSRSVTPLSARGRTLIGPFPHVTWKYFEVP